MSHNEALLGELRKYLGSAQYNPQVRESEQVLALKHDLNLAARVGQQLLMQLQAAEKQNKAHELQLEQLKASNSRLVQENQRLAAEHELLSETLESQDAEIASLVQRLQEAMARSAKLSKASQTARNLEKEVLLLEQMQADLRSELEANVQRRDAAERLARNLAQHVASTYNDLRVEMGHPSDEVLPGDVPRDDSYDKTRDLSGDNSSKSTLLNIVQDAHLKSPSDAPQVSALRDVPELTNDTTLAQNTSTTSSINAGVKPRRILPVDTATPLRPLRPTLNRAHSHESVLSLAPPSPLYRPLAPSRQLDASLAPKAVTALSGQHSFIASTTVVPRAAGSSARDRLSQMAPDRKVRVPHESRWHFTPFRK